MQRHRHDQIDLATREKFPTAARQKPSQRLSQRNFPAVFESLHDLAQRVLFRLLARITSPGASGDEVGRAPKADAANVIVAAGVGKGPAAKRAQRMGNRLNQLPAGGAKIFRVAALDAPRAGAAARRIEPVHQPVEAVREGRMSVQFHRQGDCSKSMPTVTKRKRLFSRLSPRKKSEGRSATLRRSTSGQSFPRAGEARGAATPSARRRSRCLA